MTNDSHPEARIFTVVTRFEQMAKRAGGIPRQAAIAQAEAKLEEVKAGFDDWLAVELQALTGVIAGEDAPTFGADWIAAAAFLSRQLRDSAHTLGFELLSFIANSLCELLESIKAGNACDIERVTCHVDALQLVRRRYYRHLRPDQVPELTKGLRRVADLAIA